MSENAERVAELLRPLLPPNKRAALLCVGSKLNRDDYAGMAVGEYLAPRSDERFLVALGSTAPENCTGLIRAFAPEAVIVIDAARMGEAPGVCRVLRPEQITGATFSTHMLPLPVTLSYLEAACGCQTAYVGIEPESVRQGVGMSEDVRLGANELAEALGRVLSKEQFL